MYFVKQEKTISNVQNNIKICVLITALAKLEEPLNIYCACSVRNMLNRHSILPILTTRLHFETKNKLCRKNANACDKYIYNLCS